MSRLDSNSVKIRKTICKYKKKNKILDDVNISNIITYENTTSNVSIPPAIIRQSGYSSYLDTYLHTQLASLSLLTRNN